MKILVVAEQEEIRTKIVDFLATKHILCEVADAFLSAKNKLSQYEYHVVVLDLAFSEGNGHDLIYLLKETNPQTAILIISEKDSPEEMVKLFELGVDDYLSAPIYMPELAARVKALYRRIQFRGNKYLHFEGLSINLHAQEVSVKDQKLDLTAKEYELLLLLVSNKNRVLGKDTIVEYLWGDYSNAMDHFDFIYQHIKNLRKKLKDHGGKSYIQNVYGLGYRFNANI